MNTVKTNRCERHEIRKSNPMYKIIDEYCFKSKNLYNYGNYIIRQEFIKNGNWIRYDKLTKQIKHDEPFRDIGSNSGQHTLKMLDRTWKSFFESIKDFAINPSKYLGRPRLPYYLKKNGRYVFVMTNLQTHIEDGFLRFSFKPFKPYNGLIKTNVIDKLMQTRFVFKGDRYIIEIIYEKTIPDIKDKLNKRILGIDLGVSRFATIQNNIGLKPFAINGNGLKSVNNYYNKKAAKYKSIVKRINNLNWSHNLQSLANKRDNKIDYFLHCSSKYIQQYCIDNQIDTVVIGYNQEWKQEIKLGTLNQHFVSIPFYSFISKLDYKLSDIGVKLVRTKESYTSGCSFLDGELPCKENYNKSRRVHRGLFKTDSGKLIHADVNGASNIITKVFPGAFEKGIKDVGLHPYIVNVI